MKYKAVFYARIVHVLLVRINKCTVWFHLLIGADNNTQCENEDENEEMIVAVNAIYAIAQRSLNTQCIGHRKGIQKRRDASFFSSSVRPSVRPFVRSFVHCWFIGSLVHSSICSFVHSFIHSFSHMVNLRALIFLQLPLLRTVPQDRLASKHLMLPVICSFVK